MLRFDIINEIVKKHEFSNYLEIGVRHPDDCFNKVSCLNKHAVDPNFEIKSEFYNNGTNIDSSIKVDYEYTSDNFFNLLENNQLNLSPTHKWDVIFIDGWHISNQVERDILNSLNHLSDNGYIVLHDCNPPDIYFAREDYVVNGVADAWNGTVWKAIYKLRSTRPDLFVCTVDTDWGIGIVRKGSQVCCDFNNPFYEYRVFEQHKKEHLNLITVDELKTNILGI